MALVLVACQPDLGPCDDAAARRLVFDVNGYPAYEGQALTQISCGNGVFCHSADLSSTRRLGAPSGLNFDIVGSRTPSDRLVDAAAIDRLALGRRRITANAGGCLGQVRSGLMPPGGVAGEVALAEGIYDLPSIASEEGEEIFRNWLACGAPVVERTTQPRVGVGPGEACPPGEVGDCIAREAVEPVQPTFDSIFARILFPACGNSCHGPSAPGLSSEHDLDLSSPSAAHEALMRGGVGACASADRVDVASPDASLLLQRLAGDDCGPQMPISGPYLSAEELAAVRGWIEAGAPRD